MSSKSRRRRRTLPTQQISAFHEELTDSAVVPYDEHLLERSRTQWQFGDWDSLAKVERSVLQHHPDRAKLALLSAAGHLQLGHQSEAMQYIRLAKDWGCNNKLIIRILVAGVHNSLGRASTIAGERPRAMQHFHNSVSMGTPGGDSRLLGAARINEQYRQLGLIVDLLTDADAASGRIASTRKP